MSNVLLLISDEHNPRFASPYGHPAVQTPNMQRLAQAGTVYENCYCSSPLCMPSRSSFVAGRWVHELQTYSNCNVAMEERNYPSYGAVLAEQGVHTVHIGKADVYSPGDELGFCEMLLPQDRSLPGDVNHGRTPLTIRAGAARRANGFGPRGDVDPFGRDTQFVDAAIQWLAERAPTLGRPWALALNINKPHFPQWVTQELWDMYAEGGDLPDHGADCASANHPYALDLCAHFEADQFTEEQTRGLRRGYLGCITYVDRQLGRLLHALEQSGLADETNVVYTSDHGDMMGKFGMWWKCSLYEDSVRVPLIAAGPDWGSGRVRTAVQLLDLQASLFSCLGAECPVEWSGTPLQEIGSDDPNRVAFSEYHGHGTRSGAYMVRKGDWKLIYCMEAPHQLFNLAEDPEELCNLAPGMSGKVAELDAELRGICSPEAENERAHALEREQLRRIAGQQF